MNNINNLHVYSIAFRSPLHLVYNMFHELHWHECSSENALPCRSQFHFYSFRQVIYYNLQNNRAVHRHRHSVGRMQNSSLTQVLTSTRAAGGASVFYCHAKPKTICINLIMSTMSSENELKIFHNVCKVVAKKSPRKPIIGHSDSFGMWAFYWNAKQMSKTHRITHWNFNLLHNSNYSDFVERAAHSATFRMQWIDWRMPQLQEDTTSLRIK